jgi:hypothetical protein
MRAPVFSTAPQSAGRDPACHEGALAFGPKLLFQPVPQVGFVGKCCFLWCSAPSSLPALLQVKAVKEGAARREAALQAALDEARAMAATAGGGRCVCVELWTGWWVGRGGG